MFTGQNNQNIDDNFFSADGSPEPTKNRPSQKKLQTVFAFLGILIASLAIYSNRGIRQDSQSEKGELTQLNSASNLSEEGATDLFLIDNLEMDPSYQVLKFGAETMLPQQQNECFINEAQNPLGPSRCMFDIECQGARICSVSGWCSGISQCNQNPEPVQMDDDFQFTEIENQDQKILDPFDSEEPPLKLIKPHEKVPLLVVKNAQTRETAVKEENMRVFKEKKEEIQQIIPHQEYQRAQVLAAIKKAPQKKLSLIQGPGPQISVENIPTTLVDFCSVKEQWNIVGAYRCTTSTECKGKRLCNADGWCSGQKDWCPQPHPCQIKEVIDADEKPTCSKDRDCRGDRTCNQQNVCEGFSGCPSEKQCLIDESRSSFGNGNCKFEFQCKGLRTCTRDGKCEGVSGCVTKMFCEIDESQNALGANKCLSSLECAGKRKCTNGECEGESLC